MATVKGAQGAAATGGGAAGGGRAAQLVHGVPGAGGLQQVLGIGLEIMKKYKKTHNIYICDIKPIL